MVDVHHPFGPAQHHPLERWQLVLFSAAAPALAVIFTNPFDTAKVRMQLQGETNVKLYKNSIDCVFKIAKNEGLFALQKGITPAIFREATKNIFRIGLYVPILGMIHSQSHDSAPTWKRVLAASLCGVVGAASCNPFELIKTRLQSQSTLSSAVGYQHGYTGFFDAFRQIIKKDGLRGLYQGISMSMTRTMIGSCVSLMSYTAKDRSIALGYTDGVPLDLCAGLFSGMCAVSAMNPVDVLRTRFYNQPLDANGKGVLYRNGLDCIRKIVRHEGVFVLYKGFLSHFMRMGPHYCLTFVFLGIFKRSLTEHLDQKDMKESFDILDLNKDGKLQQDELILAIKDAVPRPQDPLLMPHYERTVQDCAIRVLQKVDEEQRKGITFEAFGFVVSEMRQVLREQAIKEVFDEIDEDKNGKIEPKELGDFLKRYLPKQAQMSVKEYEELLGQDVKAMVRIADVDENGFIDLDEFSRICDKIVDIRSHKVLTEWTHKAGLRLVV